MFAKEYEERLESVFFDYAIDLLSDEIKASIFLRLRLKESKDKWLEKHANIILNN
jgi:hypothetical protein